MYWTVVKWERINDQWTGWRCVLLGWAALIYTLGYSCMAKALPRPFHPMGARFDHILFMGNVVFAVALIAGGLLLDLRAYLTLRFWPKRRPAEDRRH